MIYLEPSPDAGRALFTQGITGPVVMLNLLRLRAVADYSGAPDLAPDQPISGAAAYDLYVAHTLPLLRKTGGDVIFLGKGGGFFIGPPDEVWDLAMLVRQASLADFAAFAKDAAYLAGIGQTSLALQHEINNPLAALLSYASLIEQGVIDDPEERAEALATIVTQARRIADVVKRLRNLENPKSVEYLGEQRMIDIANATPGPGQT